MKLLKIFYPTFEEVRQYMDLGSRLSSNLKVSFRGKCSMTLQIGALIPCRKCSENGSYEFYFSNVNTFKKIRFKKKRILNTR